MGASINRIALLSGMMMMIYIYLHQTVYCTYIADEQLSSTIFPCFLFVRPSHIANAIGYISTYLHSMMSHSFLLFLAVSHCFLSFLVVSLCFSLFLIVSCYFSLFLAVSHCFLLFLIVSGRFSLFLVVSRQFSSFLVNSCQFSQILINSRCFSLLLSVSHCFSSYSYVIVFGGLDALTFCTLFHTIQT